MKTELEEYLTISEIDAAIRQMSAADWRRAEKLAGRVAYCYRLSGWAGTDLLHETFTRLLSEDSRRLPRSLDMFGALYVAMKGVASNISKKQKKGPIDEYVKVDQDDESDESRIPSVDSKDERTPENTVANREQISLVFRHLEGDGEVLRLAQAWAQGLRGEAAAEEAGICIEKFQAVRKRLERKLSNLALEPD